MLQAKVEALQEIIKIGRTHLMDVTPLTLGQEFSGHAQQPRTASSGSRRRCRAHRTAGGTAVGTGSTRRATRKWPRNRRLTGLPVTAPNKLRRWRPDAVVMMSVAENGRSLMKIANDIRGWRAVTRCGLGELRLEANEPGSSITPGKASDPVRSVDTVAAQVPATTTINVAGASGNFELNVYKPVLIYNLLQSIRLLGDAARSFNDHCAVGIEPDEQRIDALLHESLMLVTALNRTLGYDNAARIAKAAYAHGTTLKEEAIRLGLLTAEEFDETVDPAKMLGPSE